MSQSPKRTPLKIAPKPDKKPAIKRFYKNVDVQEDKAGFAIFLDGRPLKTPARQTLYLPTKSLAQLIEKEWQAADFIDPFLMPATRMANTAVDRVHANKQAIIAEMIRYGQHDLLCFRAGGPEGLTAFEKAVWDPCLQQAIDEWGLVFTPVTGLASPDDNPARDAHIMHFLEGLDMFSLAAFSELVSGLGSLVLGLLFFEGKSSFDAIWQASQLEENYQNRMWGEDSEAKARAEKRHRDLSQVAEFLKACPKNAPGLMRFSH